MLCIFVPLVWIRKTEKLAFTHILSDIIIAFVITVICVEAGINLDDFGVQQSPTMAEEAYINIGGLATGLAASVMAFEGVAVVLPTRDIAED